MEHGCVPARRKVVICSRLCQLTGGMLVGGLFFTISIAGQVKIWKLDFQGNLKSHLVLEPQP